MTHAFISTIDTLQCRLCIGEGAKDREIIGIIVESKHINGLE